MSSGLASSFTGAIQASASVLLTIFYGVIAAQTKLLSVETGRQISEICIKMFLPALLIVNLGSQIEIDNAVLYVPILVWALTYNLVSIGAGWALTRCFDLPRWFTPAITFNNTTSFPLLLIQSLGSAGVLSALAKSDDDGDSDIISRAKSYFLVSSVVSNMLVFGLGGDLLGANDEHPIDELDQSLRERAGEDDSNDRGDRENGSARRDEEEGSGDEGQSDEHTSLLPGPLPRYAKRAARGTGQAQTAIWDKLPERVQHGIALIRRFVSAPLIGALIGIFLGFVPPLKQAFFADSGDGGIFNAWITVSLKNIGELFVTLQVIVVGIKLAHSLRKMRRGHDSGSVSWLLLTLVVLVRFVIWPVLSIAIVKVLIDKTNVLDDDPVLWFVLMLMPTGPSAMKLMAMAEVDDADEDDKMSISRVLMTSYFISPLLSLAVVASLKACTE